MEFILIDFLSQIFSCDDFIFFVGFKNIGVFGVIGMLYRDESFFVVIGLSIEDFELSIGIWNIFFCFFIYFDNV